MLEAFNVVIKREKFSNNHGTIEKYEVVYENEYENDLLKAVGFLESISTGLLCYLTFPTSRDCLPQQVNGTKGSLFTSNV